MARDYQALITSEHGDKPNYSAMVGLIAGAWGSIFDATKSIPEAFDLDSAIGAQLDIIGEWVGQSRVIPNVLLVGFFGFVGLGAPLPFGEEGNVAVGGRFYDDGEPLTGSTVLADPEYRTILRAKIVRNNSFGLTADIIAALSFMFEAPAVIDDPGTMAIGIAIGRPLSLVEQAIITQLDILPRPSGVRINWLGYYTGSGYLGFAGQAGAGPFAEEGYSGPLGQLMEEF